MKYVYSFKDGKGSMRDVLGGKGANLCEMSRLGIPVPNGFIVTTRACQSFYKSNMNINRSIEKEIDKKIKVLETGVFELPISDIKLQYDKQTLSTKIDDIIKKSIEDKIDIIAISDHNTVEGSKVAVEKTKNTENLLVIPSIEISSSKGHILGFGCEEVIPRDLEPEETIDMIHNQGGLAIIPHPFCFYRHGLLCKSHPDELNFDAIETIISV